MELVELAAHWDRYGCTDPLSAILSDPTRRGNELSPSEFFESGQKEIQDILLHIKSLGYSLRLGRAMDFGCGVGRLTLALGDQFQFVDGIDISQSMVQLARKYNRHGAKCIFHHNLSEDLSIFQSDQYDFIVSLLVLQHLRPSFCRAYLREMIRVLTKGGVFVFQLTSRPHDDVLFHQIQFPSEHSKAFPRMELYGLMPNSVKALMEQCGGKVVDMRTDERAGPQWNSFMYTVLKG